MFFILLYIDGCQYCSTTLQNDYRSIDRSSWVLRGVFRFLPAVLYNFSCKNLTVLEVIFLSFCENDEGNPFNLTAKPDLEWSKDDGSVSFSIASGLFCCK